MYHWQLRSRKPKLTLGTKIHYGTKESEYQVLCLLQVYGDTAYKFCIFYSFHLSDYLIHCLILMPFILLALSRKKACFEQV